MPRALKIALRLLAALLGCQFLTASTFLFLLGADMRAIGTTGFIGSALIMLFLAGGCAPTVATEGAYAPEIYDQAQWTADVNICRGWALKYHTGFSPKAIGGAGAKGAAQNAGGGAVNILIPVAGAAGGIVYESLEELGLTDLRQQQVFIKCLDRKTEWDHSALEIEPNP